MRIVEIRDIAVPMGAAMRNAVIDFSKMTVSAVAVITDVVRGGRPVVGFGFNANGRYAQSAVIRERLAPRVLEAPKDHASADGTSLDPRAVHRLMMRNEKPGGHGERAVAVAALDIAVWDAAAKLREMPLWALIAEDAGNPAPEQSVPVYAAGGYYDPEKGTDGLVAKMQRYLDEGYTQVKMKIGGATLDEDRTRIEAVLALLGGDGARLAVDANGRFDADTALRYADALAPYGLAWYEEPGDPLDFSLNAAVAAAYPDAIATGENLFSLQDARNLLRFGGMRPEVDFVQFDPSLAYGVGETIDIVAMMQAEGWSPRRFLPHGGNLLALGTAGGLSLGGCESYPGVFQPFGGFADDTPVEDGRVSLGDAPGAGFERKAALDALLRTLL